MRDARISALVAAAGLALAAASPAAAQITGSRLGKSANSKDAKAVFDVMVRCVGERRPAYAIKIMGLMPGSKAEHDAVFRNEGDLGVCMDDPSHRVVIPDNVEMTLNARLFRTSLAQVMAREALRGFDPANLPQAPAWSPSLYTADAGEQSRRDAMQLGLYEFGDCVVAARPLEVAAVVREGVASDAGQAAVKTLLPELGPCLPKGVNLQLTHELLAVALAEPIYHRVRALKGHAVAGEGAR